MATELSCIILAGGLGTRMQHVSGSLPKALIPIGEKPFIHWQLSWLKILGISRVRLALQYRSEQIEAYLNSSNGDYPALDFAYDGDQLLGTGGALLQASQEFTDDFLVTYGDSFLIIDANALFQKHQKDNSKLTISYFENNNVGDRSNIYFDGPKLIYDKHSEIKNMKYIDFGMLALNRYFLNNSGYTKHFDLSEFMSSSSKKGLANGFEVKFPFFEIGSPDGLNNLLNFLSKYKFDLIKIKKELLP